MEVKNVSKRAFIFGNLFIKSGEVGVLKEPWAQSNYIQALIDRGDILVIDAPPKKRKRKKPS